MSHGASTTAPTTFGRNRRPRLGPPDEAARLPPDEAARLPPAEGDDECAVCRDEVDDWVWFGCGHRLCARCAPRVRRCPICRFEVAPPRDGAAAPPGPDGAGAAAFATEAGAPVGLDECPCCYAQCRGAQWARLRPCGHWVCRACAGKASNCYACRARVTQPSVFAAAFHADWPTLAARVAAGEPPDELNARAGAGQTPLHHAAAHGHAPSVALLARAGADAHRADASGWTPLFWAAVHGHRATCLLLVDELGAAPAPRDCWLATPAQWARARGHDALADVLDARDPASAAPAARARPLDDPAPGEASARAAALRRRCAEARDAADALSSALTELHQRDGGESEADVHATAAELRDWRGRIAARARNNSVDNQRRAALKREHGRGARVQALENMR